VWGIDEPRELVDRVEAMSSLSGSRLTCRTKLSPQAYDDVDDLWQQMTPGPSLRDEVEGPGSFDLTVLGGRVRHPRGRENTG
jgi:hypothetical protein